MTQISGIKSEQGERSRASWTQMRAVALPWKNAIFEPSPDGSLRVRNSTPLGPYPGRLTDRLRHWATVTPDRFSPAVTASAGGR
jgi:hypothetical protein